MNSPFIQGKWYVTTGDAPAFAGRIIKIKEPAIHAYWDVWYINAMEYGSKCPPRDGSLYAREGWWKLVDLDLPDDLMLKHLVLTYGIIPE